MSKELEKVISRLSQKSKPVPVVEEEEEDNEKEQRDLDELTKDKPEETEESKKVHGKIEELNAQIERLQNNGIYRVEMLFQRQQTNDYLKQIVDFLKKLGGED